MKEMETTELSDTDLVAGSLTGNREACGRIVARYQTLICSLAYSGTGSLSQSEDLAQETFIAAWKQLANLRELHKLRSWLPSITRSAVFPNSKGRAARFCLRANMERWCSAPCLSFRGMASLSRNRRRR